VSFKGEFGDLFVISCFAPLYLIILAYIILLLVLGFREFILKVYPDYEKA